MTQAWLEGHGITIGCPTYLLSSLFFKSEHTLINTTLSSASFLQSRPDHGFSFLIILQSVLYSTLLFVCSVLWSLVDLTVFAFVLTVLFSFSLAFCVVLNKNECVWSCLESCSYSECDV